jgi:hypothetical protein
MHSQKGKMTPFSPRIEAKNGTRIFLFILHSALITLHLSAVLFPSRRYLSTIGHPYANKRRYSGPG